MESCYDVAKLTHAVKFYVLTWSIFAGPVTYYKLILFYPAVISIITSLTKHYCNRTFNNKEAKGSVSDSLQKLNPLCLCILHCFTKTCKTYIFSYPQLLCTKM